MSPTALHEGSRTVSDSRDSKYTRRGADRRAEGVAVAAAGGLRYPPAGVATEPAPDRPYVPLKEASRRRHMDRRTLQAAVISGEIEGWARPGPQRLRWYVYEDQLAPLPPRLGPPGDDIAQLRREVAELRAGLAEVRERATPGGVDPTRLIEAWRDELRAEVDRLTHAAVADLRAHNVALTETNLLLLEAHDELGSAAQKYRRALALFMTPGHPGELTDR
jgi:hypothetical protein